jgi:predicted  nucleic acid-binding Zn-ribbon protein
MPNPFIKDTSLKPSDFVKEPDVLRFFMEDINELLDNYQPGSPENKPDVTKQIAKIQETREKMAQDHVKQQNDYNSLINKLTNINPQMAQDKIDNLTFIVQELSMENNQLKEKVKYLEDKIKTLIIEQIQFKRNCIAQQN